MDAQRKDAIAETIADELDRQARNGAARIDIAALAEAVEQVVKPEASAQDAHSPMTPREEMRAAKSPDQLNSTNDG